MREVFYEKKVLLLVVAAVLLAGLVFGGMEFYKYNSASYHLSLSKSADGSKSYPMLSFGGVSELGISKKAERLEKKYSDEFTENVFQWVANLGTTYESYTLASTVREADGKTEIHLYGEGVKKGETEQSKFEKTVLLSQVYKLDEEVRYCYLFTKE